MKPEDLSAIVVAVLTVVATLVQTARLRPAGRKRNEIKADLDLYALLPDSSDVKQDLLAHINRSLKQLIAAAETKRRDPLGIGVAVAFLVGAATAAIWLNDQWWAWPIIGFLALFGVVGLSQDAVPRERDERGRAVRKA